MIHCSSPGEKLEPVGLWLTSGEEYETEIGTLKGGFLLQNGNQIRNGKIVFGAVYMDSVNAYSINNDINILETENKLDVEVYPKVVRIGDTAIPVLARALQSNNETLQTRAVDLLVKIDGESATAALMEAYKKANENLRFHIKYYIKDIDEQTQNDTEDMPGKKWYEFWK